MIAQLGILIFGLSAMFLVNDHRPSLRKWGPVMGLAGQPFWFWATVENAQWGMVALCCVYTALWARGVYNAWIRKQ